MSSHSGTWMPAVLTWAMMQAETPVMQRSLVWTSPDFHSGQRPMLPGNV